MEILVEVEERSFELKQLSRLSTGPLVGWAIAPAINVFSFVVLCSCVIFGLAGQSYAQEARADSTKALGEIFGETLEGKANRKAETTQGQDVLVSLGINSNPGLIESSGVATCSFVENSIWTHNDSGHSRHLFLLKTDGKLLAKVELLNTRNVDWESMCRFTIDGSSYLMVGDVGDNLARRESCQLYLIKEPDLSSKLTARTGKEPIETSVEAARIEFTYPDGARNCEAIAVDVLAKQVWLIQKIYLDKRGEASPGVYVLPLSLAPLDKPMVAKRIADFPPSNVTGMDFSPDGKRLIIRNYLNAHLYSRIEDESWEDVIKKTNPNVVVLPLQRQGESVCFTRDSASVILTSELIRQPIWQVNLKSNFEQSRRIKKAGKK